MPRMKLVTQGALLVIVTVILSLPSVHIPDGPDKGIHALIFSLYTSFLYETYQSLKGGQPSWFPLIATGFLLALIGGLYEVFQRMYIPSRTGDPADWLADVAGILLTYAYYVLRRQKRGF